VDSPDISYARSGDVHVAYQSFGNGPPIIGVPPFVQNIEALWGDPSGCYPGWLTRFGSFRTITHFDKRGTGLSDRVSGPVGIEERMDDLRAVMDAAGIDRAAIGGISEGGPLALLFAATYPERVESLLLFGTAAKFVSGEGYPHGVTPDEMAFVADELAGHWATPDSILVPGWMPSLAADAEFCRWAMSYERACASPGAIRDMMRFVATVDVRSILSTIQVPTLVVHRTDDLIVPVEHGRYLAEHITGARYMELPGVDHCPWVGDGDSVLDEFEEFLTGERPGAPDIDRVLATVLFTDIVGSTELAGRLGDGPWRTLLDRHDRAAQRETERYGGRVVKSTGDGVLATFDSPSRAVRAGLAMVGAAAALGIEIRAGLHTGEIERRGEDIAGIAVHVAARVMAQAGPSELLTSATVRDLVLGAPFTFEDRGVHELKGLAGDWRILAAT
jgi:class 3 adenylate cyclase/pimeloyl-ACP methyl ester carboxylesterase